jgi:hypothetical protein
VVAAAPALALLGAGGVDTVHAGEWRVATARVEPRGEGSTVYAWRPYWSIARTTMLDWLQPDLGAARTSQVGPGTLRWVRNLAGRRAGLHVDTIGVTFVSGPALVATLLDSVYVVGGTRAPVVIVGSPHRPPATVGVPYVDVPEATGGDGAHRWTVVAGALPPGLALDAASGAIQGTPTAAGVHAFTLAVRAGDEVAQLAMTISVGWGPLTIASAAERPAGVMGAAYADTLRADGAGPGLRWHLAAGALPPGVTLDSVTGRLAGVAEAAGTFRFTVRAASEARTATGELRVTVARPALDAGAVLDQLLGTGALAADHRRFLDLLGNRNDRVDVGDVAAWLDATAASAASPPVAALRRLVTVERSPTAPAPRSAPAPARPSAPAVP